VSQRDHASGHLPGAGPDKRWINELERGRVPGPRMPQHSRVPAHCGPSTASVHAGTYADPTTGAVTSPIFQSTTFRFDQRSYEAFETGTTRDVAIYSRYGNPSQWTVQEKVATLEGAESSLVFASGMSAIYTTLLTLTNNGGHIVSALDVYGGTYALLRDDMHQLGREVTLVDPTDIDSIRAAIQPNTQVLFFESLTNPLLKAVPLAALGELSNAEQLLLLVDNTFLGPTQCRPLRHGADIVIHSATKYLSGHSDVIAGVASGSRKYVDRIWAQMLKVGGQLDPLSCFLLERGLKTLDLRVRTAAESAMHIVRFLESRQDVLAVYHPLATGYAYPWFFETASGAGAMVSFRLQGGDRRALAFMEALRIPIAATSLGGVESLVSLPFNTSHSLMTQQQRKEMGIEPGLVRFSVGIEQREDLIQDIAEALDATQGVS